MSEKQAVKAILRHRKDNDKKDLVAAYVKNLEDRIKKLQKEINTVVNTPGTDDLAKKLEKAERKIEKLEKKYTEEVEKSDFMRSVFIDLRENLKYILESK